jgi:serpin B
MRPSTLLRRTLLAGMCLASATGAREAESRAADAVNAFAFDLYEQVRRVEGNLFLSPYSVHTALSLTSLGATGGTAEEMTALLHENLGSDPHAELATLHALLQRRDEGAFELQSANALWVAKAYPFLPDFLRRATGQYRAELAELDYADTEAARSTINRWVAESTKGRIPELIGPGLPGRDTRLLLTNAIYFWGRWAAAFPKRSTGDDDFTLARGGTVRTPMMRQVHEFPYAEDADVQAIRLRYDGNVAMLVLLPRRPDGLPRLEEGLGAKGLEAWTSKLVPRKVDLSLPRFSFRRRLELAKLLAAMGMPDAFDPGKADFRKMTAAEGLMLSDVLHEAFVRVDEEGTEAAAATAVTVEPTASLREIEEPIVFRADRPFLFFIRESTTGAILFVGRVANPTQ